MQARRLAMQRADRRAYTLSAGETPPQGGRAAGGHVIRGAQGHRRPQGGARRSRRVRVSRAALFGPCGLAATAVPRARQLGGEIGARGVAFGL